MKLVTQTLLFHTTINCVRSVPAFIQSFLLRIAHVSKNFRRDHNMRICETLFCNARDLDGKDCYGLIFNILNNS